MRFRRAILFAFEALVVAGLGLACADNGDSDERPPTDVSRLDAGSSKSPPGDAGTPSKDAGVDAKTDATSDGEAGPPPPSSATMRIQEVYVDHDGLGDGAEYVELRGAPGTPVDDLFLRALRADGSVYSDVAIADVGDVVGSTGTWVVGGSTIFNLVTPSRVDQSFTVASWGLANGNGSIQLLRGAARDLVDVVGYVSAADAGGLTAPGSPPTATSEGLPVILPTTAKRAFGRLAGAADTGDNRTDFCALAPTPGAATQPASCN